jgi:hypothetical protein
MTEKSTVIQQPPLRLIVSQWKDFPEGTGEAFAELESHLATLKGRKFYGLVYETGSGMTYYAGLVPDSETEEQHFASLGFPIREVAGGPCARRKLRNWRTKTDQIGTIMGSMIREHGIDPTRPQMEFYRSLDELHLLLPLPS